MLTSPEAFASGADQLMQQADALCAVARIQDAINLLRNHLVLHAGNADYVYKLACLYFESSEHAESLPLLHRCIELGKGRWKIYLKVAHAFASIGSPEEGFQFLRDRIDGCKANDIPIADRRLQLVRFGSNRNVRHLVADMAEEVIEWTDSEIECLDLVFQSLLSAGRIEGAWAFAEAGQLKDKPLTIQARLGLAAINLVFGRPSDSLSLWFDVPMTGHALVMALAFLDQAKALQRARATLAEAGSGRPLPTFAEHLLGEIDAVLQAMDDPGVEGTIRGAAADTDDSKLFRCAALKDWALRSGLSYCRLEESHPFRFSVKIRNKGTFIERAYHTRSAEFDLVCLRHALVGAGEVLVPERNVVLKEGVIHNNKRKDRMFARFASDTQIFQKLPTQGRALVGEYVFLGGDKNFFHFYYNFLLRASVLDLIPALRSRPVIVRKDLPAHYMDWLVAVGVDSSKIVPIEPSEICQVESLWFPSIPFYNDGVAIVGAQNALETVRQRLLKGISHPAPGNGRRLYLSRRDAQWRRVSNEADLVPVLDRFGFETVTLGSMPVAQQISLMAEAEIIVGPHGSQMATMFLAPRHAQIVELSFPFTLNLNTMVLPSAVIGHRIWRVNGPALHAGDSNFSIDPVDLDTTLQLVVLELENRASNTCLCR